MMEMLVWIAVWLRKTADNIATPCSVNAWGRVLECLSLLNRSQFVTSSFFSSKLSCNLKPCGNLSVFR